jgi:hypothetical protein
VLDAALTALEASAPATLLRGSRYAYPLVNAAHIIGLATLFGAILALDLRLLGLFRAVPPQPLAQVLPRVSAAGLGLALLTGLALFSVQPLDYLAHPVFPVKLALIAAAIAHALGLRRTAAWRAMLDGGPIGARLRLSAAVSLFLWSGAILAGRLLAF